MSSELKVDKISPATGTSTTLGDSGDTFTVPSGVTLDTSSSTLTLPSSAITGQTEKTSLVDADKFLVSDSAASGVLKYVQKSNLPSGNLVPLATVTTNNSSVGNFTFDNVFDSTYESYRILGYVAPDSSNNALQFEWRTGSSGSNNTFTSSEYNWVHFGARIDNGNATGTDVTGEYNAARAKISGHSVQSDFNSSYTAFDMTLTDPRAVFMSRCNWYGVTTYQNASSHRHFNGTFGGSMNSNANATGITFSYTGINIKYGRITVYGVTHA